MAKGYYLSVDGGESFEAESLLTTADITLLPNTIANQFFSAKDSNDNIYIFCGYYSSGAYPASCFGRIIKIDKLGNKTYTNLPYGTNTSMVVNTKGKQIALTRDEQNVIISNLYSDHDNIIPVTAFDADINTGVARVSFGNIITDRHWELYQDRYIWTASGSTVSVYDYTTKVLIDSETIAGNSHAICCSADNALYAMANAQYSNTYRMYKCMLNGNVITSTSIATIYISDNYVKQMLIDRWGDLVILTNSGTASRLLKYTTAGVLIDDIDLSVAEILGVGRVAYSLNVYSTRNPDGTLKDCQVSVENDLGLWLSEPVTRQGELFGTFTKKLSTGNVTYGNDNGGDNNYSVRC